ncbi:putative sulfatase [Dysgonomonas hofstadii]|uniref:Putative sulfatase n=1 Tax=Dysgonomonas hofstadii TaxID=637886 RepID=A0A840CPD8_9BACT|nr:sulfatase [Dysgonomonas hofstadii]MBB4037256.1 putative sulfatase [Dysgonomonas hofstadii]
MNTLNINPVLLKATALSATILPIVGMAGNKNNPKDNRPNIVVIVADDLLSSELSCYGGQNLVTHNIDKLASEGVRFTHNYASVAMSVPIRASMYTGLYPMHHGSYQNHKKTNPGTKTSNEYMIEEGYRVGRTGKDHPVNPAVYKFEKIPGFTVGCTAQKAPFTIDGIRKFITRNDDPFLLYVCSIHPHAPWTWGDPGEFDKDKLVMPENCVDNPAMREIYTKYLAEVRALDNEVGAVVKVLTEAGKLDNTIVIFLGEQGPQFPGGKWTCWYPGVNSALIARYPSEIKAGAVSNAIVQYEDLLPTFIDVAGGKTRKELDGISFKKALYGKTNDARKYAYGIHNNYPEGPPYPIRSIRDQKYALIWNLTPEKEYHEKHLMKADNNVTGVWPVWKSSEASDPKAAFLINRFVHRPEFEFYDVENDPWEMTNLIDKPEHQSRIKEMKQELKKWMDEQGDSGIAVDIRF